MEPRCSERRTFSCKLCEIAAAGQSIASAASAIRNNGLPAPASVDAQSDSWTLSMHRRKTHNWTSGPVANATFETANEFKLPLQSNRADALRIKLSFVQGSTGSTLEVEHSQQIAREDFHSEKLLFFQLDVRQPVRPCMHTSQSWRAAEHSSRNSGGTSSDADDP